MFIPYQLHHLLGTVYNQWFTITEHECKQSMLGFQMNSCFLLCFAHLAVLGLEILFDWKLSLIILLRLISLLSGPLNFHLPKSVIYLPWAIGPVFFLPCLYATFCHTNYIVRWIWLVSWDFTECYYADNWHKVSRYLWAFFSSSPFTKSKDITRKSLALQSESGEREAQKWAVNN